jgi:hypothetical protein
MKKCWKTFDFSDGFAKWQKHEKYSIMWLYDNHCFQCWVEIKLLPSEKHKIAHYKQLKTSIIFGHVPTVSYQCVRWLKHDPCSK